MTDEEIEQLSDLKNYQSGVKVVYRDKKLLIGEEQ
jgi:hypothetical protein